MENTTTVTIEEIVMFPTKSYGQYRIDVDFYYNDSLHKAAFHSTNSQLWDIDDITDELLLQEIGGNEALINTLDQPVTN